MQRAGEERKKREGDGGCVLWVKVFGCKGKPRDLVMFCPRPFFDARMKVRERSCTNLSTDNAHTILWKYKDKQQ